MQSCPQCGERLESDDVFCSKCGTRVDAQPASAAPGPQPIRPVKTRKRRSKLLLLLPIQLAIAGAAAFFVMKGCDKAEGTLVVTSQEHGDFTFTAMRCGSGQRMGFFGVIVAGEGPNDGGILVVEDPVKGKLVRVEVPGSCEPPDLEECTEFTILKDQCSVFKSSVRNTNTTVNDVRLREGYLELDCSLEDGGTARAKIKFEGCG